ncbi:MAG: SH3 domain-containing protein, partial [Lachnospiraceae bacterium]|nr:SH3 domain-containing protein [Lachnospiraceae bacterium]
MKKVWKKMLGMTAGFLGTWLMICFTAAAAPAETLDSHTIVPAAAAMVANTQANVRSGPSLAYPVIGGLSNGQVVNVCGQADTGWYQIVYGTGIGYVSNELLTQVPVNHDMLTALVQQAAFVKQQIAAGEQNQAAQRAQAAAQQQAAQQAQAAAQQQA